MIGPDMREANPNEALRLNHRGEWVSVVDYDAMTRDRDRFYKLFVEAVADKNKRVSELEDALRFYIDSGDPEIAEEALKGGAK